jgi:4'-phosphopantetheinyl transferase
VALARHGRVGVDLEQLLVIEHAAGIARLVFTREEWAATVSSVPASERDRAFLTCWTGKEAL